MDLDRVDFLFGLWLGAVFVSLCYFNWQRKRVEDERAEKESLFWRGRMDCALCYEVELEMVVCSACGRSSFSEGGCGEGEH